MRRIALALLVATTAAPAAHALDRPPLCRALTGMAQEARRSGQPLRIWLGETCRPGQPGQASAAFCEAAVGYPGHALPWALHDCVNTMAGDPQVTTGAADPALPKGHRLTHLAAKLGGGVRLDAAASGAGYDVVVWRPR